MKPKFLIVLIAFAAVVYFVFTGKQEEAARDAALPGIASDLGLSYVGNASPSDVTSIAFPLVADAADLQSKNLLTGTHGNAEIRVADLSYRLDTANNEIAGNENPNRRDQTVVVVSDSAMSLPDMVIRPTSIIELKAKEALDAATEKGKEFVDVIDQKYGAEIRRVGDQIEVQYADVADRISVAAKDIGTKIDPRVKSVVADLDPKVRKLIADLDPKVRSVMAGIADFLPEMPTLDIDFPDHPEFSEKYIVAGASPEAVGASLSSDALDYLGRISPLSLEARGNEFIVYRDGEISAEGSLGSLVEEARRLHELLTENQ